MTYIYDIEHGGAMYHRLRDGKSQERLLLIFCSIEICREVWPGSGLRIMPTGASPWSKSFLLSFLAQLSGRCISGYNKFPIQSPGSMDSLHTGLYVASHCQPIFSTWSCYKGVLPTSHLFSSHLWTLKLFSESSSSRSTMKVIVQVYETKNLVATAQESLVVIDF